SAGCKPECSELPYLCWQYQDRMHHSSIYFFSVDPEKAFADIIGTKPIYLEAHRLMEVVPASHLIQNLAKSYINLNPHGLGPKGVKDIISAMVSNTTITQLEFEDSCVLIEGTHQELKPLPVCFWLICRTSMFFSSWGVVCTQTLMAVEVK
uniref:Uncharacterized protein n=1 Tax=Geospiza parvula TaxID=87175 RepID=A0A8U8C1R8_GEOPR